MASPETHASTLTAADIATYTELAAGAQSAEDLQTLREMALEDAGGTTTLTAIGPDGQPVTKEVTAIGADEYANLHRGLAKRAGSAIGKPAGSWQDPNNK